MSNYSAPRSPEEIMAQTHGRMGLDEKELLMAYLLRNPAVFMEAKQILTPEHFTEAPELIYAVAWRTVLDLHGQYDRLPDYHILEADAIGRAEAAPDEITESGVDELRRFLEYIYGIPQQTLSQSEPGYDLLQKFLKERHWLDPIKQLLQEYGNDVPVDMPAILHNFQNRYSQVQGVRSHITGDLVPDNWEQEALTLIPTGMDFIDLPMGGGWSPGEVYGLLGTFGSGKTMMACQLAAAGAKSFQANFPITGEPRRVHYFAYETSPNDIRRRIISNLATIDLNHLNTPPWSETLSRTGRRHSYEEQEFPGDPLGEWERYNAFVMPLNNLIRISDMRGKPPNVKAGSGGVDEIRAELERDARLSGVAPGLVFIDYAGVCVKRYLKARNMDPDRQMRHYLGSFGDDCRRLIADHFNCGVWVVAQLSGQANRRGAAASMSHADSAEATNFAENLWYSACLGNKDRATSGVRFDFTKTRRSAGVPEPSVLRLQGHLARFVDAKLHLMIDPNTNRIVSINEGRMVNPEQAVNPAATVRAPIVNAPRSNSSGAMAGVGRRRP